ncbi:helix-turn-helix domain-containing protein [Cupriavidus pauculus]|uniref:helix-turn-helix domain-containing protein n=1 Tax=Cupriavidus pauculus TaxID=82633 RepID=UPI001D0CB315|nr:XRE family transcriptional regulator [Cupriavidus pauculus]
MTIATRLDRLMQDRKVKSQSALARMADVPQPTINRILKGQTETPELSTIKKIARALQVPSIWLIEGPDGEPPRKGMWLEALAPEIVEAEMQRLREQAREPIEDRVRRSQIEALHDLIDKLPDSYVTKLLAFLQEGDFSIFDVRAQSTLERPSGEGGRVIAGGEPDPVPVSNKRVKTR